MMDRALDLRHIEQRGEWETSTGHRSRSRSYKRINSSVSPIRDEHGMYKPSQSEPYLL